MRRTYTRLLLLTSLAFYGCDGPSSSYTPPSRPSEVMNEKDRGFVVDHMVGQGASRDEAEAFTRALNEAQREWEAKNR